MNIRQEIEKLLAEYSNSGMFNNVSKVEGDCYNIRNDIEELVRKIRANDLPNVVDIDEMKDTLRDVENALDDVKHELENLQSK